MDGWREVLPFAILIVAAFLFERAPWLREQYLKFTPIQRFGVMLDFGAATAIGLALNTYLYSGIGLTWAGLGDAVMTALMAFFTGQGYHAVEKFFRLQIAVRQRLEQLEAK
jgi:hypothetical protein